MEALEIATPVKGISIRDLIIEMEVQEEKSFSMKSDQTVRSAISSSIKVDYPERKYTTKRSMVGANRVLMVKREK